MGKQAKVTHIDIKKASKLYINDKMVGEVIGLSIDNSGEVPRAVAEFSITPEAFKILEEQMFKTIDREGKTIEVQHGKGNNKGRKKLRGSQLNS